MAADSNSRGDPRAIIHRLVRTLSGKAETKTPPSFQIIPPDPSPVNALTTQPEDSNQTADAPDPAPEPLTAKQRVTVLAERVRNLAKFKKDQKPSARDAEPELGPNVNSLSTADSPGPVISDTSTAIGDQQLQVTDTNPAPAPPEPTSFAKKLKALIDSLPSAPSPGPSRTIPKPKPPAHDKNGKPIPPPGSVPINDSNLITLLSTPSVMNGSIGRGRQSIWDALNALPVPNHSTPAGGGETGGEDGDDDGGSETSSIMLYSPLVPQPGSLVELADSEMVPVPTIAEEVVGEVSKWDGIWPYITAWKRGSNTQQPQPAGSSPAPSPGAGGSKPKTPTKPAPKVQKQQVWIPSTTKLSVKTLWWGYRLYLPPPVLVILGNDELEATQRAAMITTALQWIVNNIPTSLVPAPLQPALALLRKIAPYIGYIGAFIAWSWSNIKSYDKGNGVILSATWLLPIALIPSTLVPPATPPATPPASVSFQEQSGSGSSAVPGNGGQVSPLPSNPPLEGDQILSAGASDVSAVEILVAAPDPPGGIVEDKGKKGKAKAKWFPGISF